MVISATKRKHRLLRESVTGYILDEQSRKVLQRNSDLQYTISLLISRQVIPKYPSVSSSNLMYLRLNFVDSSLNLLATLAPSPTHLRNLGNILIPHCHSPPHPVNYQFPSIPLQNTP